MTSMFDPLYEVSTAAPPSLEEINKTLAEFDGSGSGLMTARQLLAACKEIQNLGFTAEELAAYVKEGQEVAGDGAGKIKMSEFATYLAFEAKKKYNKTQKAAAAASSASPDDDDNENGMVYMNPFQADGAQDQKQGMKITLTPDPKQSPSQSGQKVDMKGSYSPTQADPTDLPNWFGHSLNTIQNHPNDPSTVISPFDLFDDDDGKQASNGAPKPSLMNVETNDILFRQDSDTTGTGTGSSELLTGPNLSPTKAKSMANDKKHGISKSTSGLIAPPRSKGDKRSSTKKKKSKPKHGAAVSASFTNVFGMSSDDLGLDKASKKDKPLKLRDTQSAAVPDTSKSYVPAVSRVASDGALDTKAKPPSKRAPKKKRPKIDAIVEMKRGAAMLKYGRRGFPHFRRFQVSHDLTKLLWYSRKKSLADTHVAVKDMKDILDGQQTEVFKQCTQKTLEKASFSIIYGSKLKSLDVVAKSAEEAELWIKGLKGLIKANQQGKLHKVVQILVDVDFKDISKTKYRRVEDEAERKKYEIQHKNRPELVNTISTTLQQSKKIFASLEKISKSNNVQNSNEFENIQTLTSEVEERMEEISYGLENKTAELTDLKRDVWVLKVDVTVLEEKVKVLSKIKTAIPI